MYTQTQKTDVKPNKQPRHSTTTALPAVPKIAATIHHSMVAEAAYYAAERRGFAPGCELEDWLTAEREIEATLSKKD